MEARCILAFAGHMIDQPTRSSPRFPESAESAVRCEIHKAIINLAPTAAIASAACGGDIIFAEEVLKQEIPLYVILPFQDKEDFIQRSVAYAGEHWVQRFRTICTQAHLSYFVKPGSYESDKDFEDNQRALIFYALGFAAAVNIQLVCLVLYDNTQPSEEIGGTQSFLRLCEELEIPCITIDLVEIRRSSTSKQVEP